MRRFGIAEGGRIALALEQVQPAVQFTSRGRRYWMAADDTTTYHLLNSIEPIRRLAEFVAPTDRVVVDVGAHSGLFSAFARDRAPDVRLIVVEPDPSLAPVIGRNLAGDWQLTPKAVGAASGSATFHRSRSSTQTSSLLEGAVEAFGSDIETVEVEVTTLDDLLVDLPQIDVLKIDVQGAEGLVVQGGRQTLTRVRTLLIEISLLAPGAAALLLALEAEFGTPTRVNIVAGGADLAFIRDEMPRQGRRSV